MRNALVEFILRLFGLGDKSLVERLVRGVLLGGGPAGAAGGGPNPLEILMAQFKDKGLGDIFQS